MNKIPTKYIITPLILGLSACGSDTNNKKPIKTLYPRGEAQSITMKYTNNGKIKAILVTEKMQDYSNVKYPFLHFPKKIDLTFFDNNGNKNKITANKATIYNTTGVIDLRGDVTITTHNNTVMKTPQLYFNKNTNWFFTENYFKVTTANKSYFEGVGIDFDSQFRFFNAQQNRGQINDVEE